MDGVDLLARRMALLPAEAPLAMPEQRLNAAPTPTQVLRPIAGMAWRRVLVLGGALALTGFATWEMSHVLGLARWSVTGLMMTTLFAALFVWIALAFTSGCAGFVVLLGRASPDIPDLDSHDPAGPRARAALLMPVYNEDVPRVMAGLAAMRAALRRAGHASAFDIFVLSDSTDPARQAQELQAVLRARDHAGPALYYRRRTDNTGRKAGNVAEWVRRFGADYEYFLVLDADSLMEAETLLALVRAMEADDHLGLVQSLPLLHGGRTAFARLQQVAGAVYGPLIAAGLSWWTGNEGNYWGHNALIRTRAFADTAGLPRLPGRKPFGGDIMSHDFVEAALMRRAGWAVRMAPRLGGSHETGPPTLPDMAVRDRRWCQGNLQHLGVIGARGLHPVSRLHMASGIAAYVSAPVWLAFLFLGFAVSIQARFILPNYFPNTHALFPTWPVVDAERAMMVFGATLLLLLAPKLLGAIAFALSPQRPRGALGWLAFGASFWLEILASALLSPVTMLSQAGQCVSVLRGADGGWEAQRRDGDAITLAEGWRLGWQQCALGLVLLGLALAIAPALAAWMIPVILGLVIAPWLISVTSSEALGLALQRRGLLATPWEQRPSALLRMAARDAA